MLTTALWACSVSPRPEPPPAEPRPTLDTSLVSLDPVDCPASCVVTGVVIQAASGAVSDAPADVWIVNLDSLDQPTIVEVADDGSFRAGLQAELGDEIRLQIRRGASRSDPFDFVVKSYSAIEPSLRALGNCLALAPSTHAPLAFPGPSSATLRISNQCEETVNVNRVAMRVVDTPYSLTSASGPFAIASNNEATVEVALADAPNVSDAIVFIEVDAPAYDRRPITLYPVERK